MQTFKYYLFSLVLFSSLSVRAQMEFFPNSIAHMEEGLRVTEELFNFIATRPCEAGLVEGCDGPMPREDITKLKSILLDLNAWKQNTLANYIDGLKVFQDGKFDLESGPHHEVKILQRFNPAKIRFEKYLKVIYNPNDINSQRFSQEIRISSGMGLLLYDSFFKLAEYLSKAKKVRSLLEYDMPEGGSIVSETYKIVMDKEFWNQLHQGVEFLVIEDELSEGFPEAESARYFEQYISKSFTGEQIKSNDRAFRLQSILLADNILNQTKFFESLDRFVWSLSKFFGNTAGKFQSRDGKLKILGKDQVLMSQLKGKLEPMDILFEKTPFRLTDFFIPGYYGHVAIWLGTPEELSQMEVNYNGELIPLLSHPEVLPHLEKMSQGKLIVEALRKPGVTMNTFEHFLDVDDLLVTRSVGIKNIPEMVLKTIRQVGKLYDFNFDVETDKTVVCSELAYMVYTDHEWPTSRSMGRFTISPDHVAWRAVESEFYPVLMYVDGLRIEDQVMKDSLEDLLSRPGGISQLNRLSCQ